MAPKDKILVVEDDPAILNGLCHNLKYEGYDVRSAIRGDAVLPIVAEFAPHLIVLDLMLPGRNGFDVLKQLRSSGNAVHVIVLSARTNEDDKVRALELGADDYVTKPFGLREFLARIASAMRRVHARTASEHAEIQIGEVTLLPAEKRAVRNGESLKLTAKACDLLIFLARHPGRVFSREALLKRVWSDSYEGTARTVDNFVVQIRAQIEDDPANPTHLITVHGAGYRFDQ